MGKINEQIKRLEQKNSDLMAKCIRAKAIKEIAERLKQVLYNDEYTLIRSIIDNLVKEMVGDNDDK